MKEIIYTSGGYQFKRILTYNIENKVILYTDHTLTSAGLDNWHNRYEFTYNGNTYTHILRRSSDSNNVYMTKICTVDNNNNITNIKTYNGSGHLDYEEFYSDFDDKHFFQQSLHSNISSEKRNNHRHYIRKDANGDILTEYAVTYEYNDDGYPTRQVNTSPSGAILENKYEYKIK